MEIETFEHVELDWFLDEEDTLVWKPIEDPYYYSIEVM